MAGLPKLSGELPGTVNRPLVSRLVPPRIVMRSAVVPGSSPPVGKGAKLMGLAPPASLERTSPAEPGARNDSDCCPNWETKSMFETTVFPATGVKAAVHVPLLDEQPP